MLIVKLIRIAGLLKDAEIAQHFKDGRVDTESLVKSLKPELVIEIARVATGKEIVNEIDAIAGLITFFLSLLKEMRDSHNLKELVALCPLETVQKETILRMLSRT
jgi:hypothetical protein